MHIILFFFLNARAFGIFKGKICKRYVSHMMTLWTRVESWEWSSSPPQPMESNMTGPMQKSC